MAATFVLATAVAGCAKGEQQRRVESEAELEAQDRLAFERSPDVGITELRRRLAALGVGAEAIRESTDPDHGIAILALRLSDAQFAAIDKAALAALLLDSRYRFDLVDQRQQRALAAYSVEEDRKRRRDRYWTELKANGELDIFPRYRAGSDMTAYARRLEDYCGYEPGEALTVIDGRWLQYRNAMVDGAVRRQQSGAPGMAAFKCMVRIIYATELQPYFIGNRGRPGATIN